MPTTVQRPDGRVENFIGEDTNPTFDPKRFDINTGSNNPLDALMSLFGNDGPMSVLGPATITGGGRSGPVMGVIPQPMGIQATPVALDDPTAGVVDPLEAFGGAGSTIDTSPTIPSVAPTHGQSIDDVTLGIGQASPRNPTPQDISGGGLLEMILTLLGQQGTQQASPRNPNPRLP